MSAPSAVITSPAATQEETITPVLPLPTQQTQAPAVTTPPKKETPAAPAPALRPAAPEKPAPAKNKVTDEIYPTGPEVYIYFIGFALSQVYIFRRKILAFVADKIK